MAAAGQEVARIKALIHEVVQFYGQGKFAQATPIAEEALTLAASASYENGAVYLAYHPQP